jgi:type IV pilus assembly protein PilB
MMQGKRLGELLIEAGLINREQLNQALGIQKRTGEKLGQVLTRLEYISTDKLIEFLSKQHGAQSIDLGKELVDEGVIGLIPEHVARRYRAVPVKFKVESGSKKLVVSMAYPSNLEVVDTIRFISGYSIEPVFVREESIEWFITYCYHKRIGLK